MEKDREGIALEPSSQVHLAPKGASDRQEAQDMENLSRTRCGYQRERGRSTGAGGRRGAASLRFAVSTASG